MNVADTQLKGPFTTGNFNIIIFCNIFKTTFSQLHTAQMKAWHDQVCFKNNCHYSSSQLSLLFFQGFFKPDSDVLIRVRHPDDKITGFQPVARIDWKKYWGGH